MTCICMCVRERRSLSFQGRPPVAHRHTWHLHLSHINHFAMLPCGMFCPLPPTRTHTHAPMPHVGGPTVHATIVHRLPTYKLGTLTPPALCLFRGSAAHQQCLPPQRRPGTHTILPCRAARPLTASTTGLYRPPPPRAPLRFVLEIYHLYLKYYSLTALQVCLSRFLEKGGCLVQDLRQAFLDELLPA